jgi:hypothetical protein
MSWYVCLYGDVTIWCVCSVRSFAGGSGQRAAGAGRRELSWSSLQANSAGTIFLQVWML